MRITALPLGVILRVVLRHTINFVTTLPQLLHTTLKQHCSDVFTHNFVSLLSDSNLCRCTAHIFTLPTATKFIFTARAEHPFLMWFMLILLMPAQNSIPSHDYHLFSYATNDPFHTRPILELSRSQFPFIMNCFMCAPIH